MAINEERGFLKAIRENPKDAATRLAYADWLEEHARPYDALQQRIKAGVSEARYMVRRKSDGLYSNAGWPVTWSAKGKPWRRLGDVKGHLTAQSRRERYGDAPWDDVEVVVFEVRVQEVAGLPVTRERDGVWHRAVVHEPAEGRQG